MKGVVLAAGRGERLAALGLGVPKPMVPLAGKPLLEHTVALLRQHGVCELFINLHHDGDAIVSYFDKGQNFGVKIHYLSEAQLSGTAGPLRVWERALRTGTFLVVYGDVLTDVDLAGLLEFHRTRQATATIGVHRSEEPERCGVLSFDEAGRVTRFIEKPGPHEVFSTWVNAGLYALEPNVLDAIPSEGEADFGRDVFPALVRSGRSVYAYPLDGYLIDVGAPDRYAQAEEDLRTGRCVTYAAG